MDSKGAILKNFITIIGCLMLFSIPLLGIFMLWDFDLTNTSSSIKSLLIPKTSEQSGNYNFTIVPGEDAILTTQIKDQGTDVTVVPRSNPAVLLKIDSASIEGSVVHGSDGEDLLKQGFWHFPASVYPGEQGLSSIFGHRRYHLPPEKDTFYHLDKVNVGDRIEIMLQDSTWLEYTVTNTEIIYPSQLQDVLNEQTDKYMLKLFTCTPLGTDEQRLIITAEKTF